MVSNRAAKIPGQLTNDLNSLILFEWKITHSKQVWRRVKKRSVVEDDIALLELHFNFLSCLPYPLIGIKVSQTLFTFFLCSEASLSSPSPEVSFVPLLHFPVRKLALFGEGVGRLGCGRLEGSGLFCPPKCSPLQGCRQFCRGLFPSISQISYGLTRFQVILKMWVNGFLPTFLFSDSEYCKRSAEMVCPTCSHKRICSLLSR